MIPDTPSSELTTVPFSFQYNIRYPLGGYTFGVKDAQPVDDPTTAAMLKNLQLEYEKQGTRHSVDAVLVVHEHGHPHILMLQISPTMFILPGASLKPGEDFVEGLKQRLDLRLAPPATSSKEKGSGDDWEIGELLTEWCRPNFGKYILSWYVNEADVSFQKSHY